MDYSIFVYNNAELMEKYWCFTADPDCTAVDTHTGADADRLCGKAAWEVFPFYFNGFC